MNAQNIKDLPSIIARSAARIHDQLKQHQDLRYVLIKKGEKKPFEPRWQSENNYPADNPKLLGHLTAGGNYGVICGFGNLAVFDCDEVDRLGDLGVLDKLPRTFAVHTGGGGSHRYYFCTELKQKIILYDPILKDPQHPDRPFHLGEIQSKGQQVVGPGSIHPNGNTYEVIDDSPIREISLAELMDAIKDLKTSRQIKKTKQQDRKIRNKGNQISKACSSINKIIKIEDIAMPTNIVSDDGTEIQGSHPVHGSASGKNFSINLEKNTWHCFRCNSGGGPFEWLAVKSGLISCEEAGPGCLRGNLFRQVLKIARGLGYEIPDQKQSRGQVNLIENRIVVNKLPEDLPTEPIIVTKGPPRIGKTYWATTQLIKAGEGNYITHRHSIVKHAIEDFHEEGGQYAVWLEGKHRRGICRKEIPSCTNCQLCPHDGGSYMELKEIATKLLNQYKILTKAQVPSDLCPYYILKLAEESANYCFTVVNFIEDIQQRALTVLDEDSTLAYLYPASIELFRYKKEHNEYKIDNTLGKVWEQASSIRNAISEKERPREEYKALFWAIDTLGGLNEAINITISGKSDHEQCYQQMANELASRECTFTFDIKEKALTKLDDYRIQDPYPENDIKKLISTILYTYQKKPLHLISSGGSGYNSVYLIGDANAPVINMHWTDTVKASGYKILIIGNTLAELFGKSLGDAVVLEIKEFKYRRNFIVLPIDSSGEDNCRGDAQNQRLKVRKLTKAVAGDSDGEIRRPVMALVGSKEHQEWLMRSLGGISHASQEEGEIGQQWNYRGGYVNIIYQNSVVSRGLDVDQYNVMCVHDTDFIQPFWAAAREAGEVNAEAILNSIQMDETTNSVLRISPIMGGNELRPKIVIIPREDLWKVRYLDEQVLGGQQGGRTPDIILIAQVITENNLTGTSQLTDGGISIDSTLSRPGWDDAVKDGKLVEYFKLELDRVKAKGNFTEEELKDAMDRIIKVLKKAGRGKALSIPAMKKNGLKCKNILINPALRKLYYDGKIANKGTKKTNKWSLK
jgi:hypothetical protein